MTLQPKEIMVVGEKEENLKKFYPDAVIFSMEKTIKPVDLIFANLFLPWCEELKTTLQHFKKFLKPDGLFLFSALGPDTLSEVQDKQCIRPRLVDIHDLGDLLVQAHFSDPVLEVERLTFQYRSTENLQQELQDWQLIQGHSVFSSHEITFEIIYGHAFGNFASDEKGVTKIPLSYLKKDNRIK